MKKTKLKTWLTRVAALLGALLLIYLGNQPDVASLKHKNPRTTAFIQLREQQARKAHVRTPTVMIWRNLDEISPNLVHAVLLSEDDRFYEHHGFDLGEIWEAVKRNVKERRYAYGGSTITQQLARTLFLSPRKNMLRKLKEAMLTYRLEHALSKRRILELYLNVVEWGRGIYGAEAASLFYYGKPAIDLSADEAVALVSILPSPRRWSPMSEKSFMARRRTQLLERMERAGYAPYPVMNDSIDPFEGEPPLEPPQVSSGEAPTPIDAPPSEGPNAD